MAVQTGGYVTQGLTRHTNIPVVSREASTLIRLVAWPHSHITASRMHEYANSWDV
jgi:hypothetical protein